MKVALVHDFFLKDGGAERVFINLVGLFPDADIFTLLYNEDTLKKLDIDQGIVKASFLQDFSEGIKKRHRLLLPLFPTAIERLDLSNYDLVISSSSAFSKGVITRSKTKHICYCHSPMRYVWDSYPSYINQNTSSFMKPFVHLYLSYLRMWDKASSERVDHFIANSENVKARIKKYYRKDSTVIYPPVEVDKYELRHANADFFLIVSRLEPYKRIDTAIQAFNLLPNRKLVIIGEGSDRERLEKMSEANIEFLGYESDQVKKEYYENCRAFIATAEDEDFGITPVEAMACGKPVLALRKGGYLETIIESVTGEFYDKNHPKDLMDGLIKLLENEPNYDSQKIRHQAEKFSVANFENNLATLLDKII